jgi:hypothetical protein
MWLKLETNQVVSEVSRHSSHQFFSTSPHLKRDQNLLIYCLSIPSLNIYSMFGWLVADGWCWFVLREKYCWLVADG